MTELRRLADMLPGVKRVANGPPEPQYECDFCHDWHEVRRNGSTVPCPHCGAAWVERQAADRRELRARMSGLPTDSETRLRFSTWQARPTCQQAYKAAVAFPGSDIWSLTLWGPCGTGKSHLAAAIAWDWLEADRGTVLYYQVERFLDEIRRGYHEEDGAEAYRLLDWAMRCSLLVLDDLAAEKPTDWAVAKLDEIVNERYGNGRRTVVTANVQPGRGRIPDRLCAGLCVELKGDSWRRRGK